MCLMLMCGDCGAEREQQQAAEVEHYLREVAALKQDRQQLSEKLSATQVRVQRAACTGVCITC